jgi:hypothetical protein
MRISTQRALDSLDDERMEPNGLWAFDPDTERDREIDRHMEGMMREWLAKG